MKPQLRRRARVPRNSRRAETHATRWACFPRRSPQYCERISAISRETDLCWSRCSCHPSLSCCSPLNSVASIPPCTHRGVSPELFFPGMMGYLILMLMTPAYNCFAYEGRGIQTYFTAPLRFRDVLLGKNLMHAGVLAFEIVLSMHDARRCGLDCRQRRFLLPPSQQSFLRRRSIRDRRLGFPQLSAKARIWLHARPAFFRSFHLGRLRSSDSSWQASAR